MGQVILYCIYTTFIIGYLVGYPEKFLEWTKRPRILLRKKEALSIVWGNETGWPMLWQADPRPQSCQKGNIMGCLEYVRTKEEQGESWAQRKKPVQSTHIRLSPHRPIGNWPQVKGGAGLPRAPEVPSIFFTTLQSQTIYVANSFNFTHTKLIKWMLRQWIIAFSVCGF